jgi:adenine-specific DNA methylase
MTWDFAEVNFFSESVGSIEAVVKTLSVPLDYLLSGTQSGTVQQADAQLQVLSRGAVVSTDPPYYDNIGYADLSDFFYVWLRRSLRPVLGLSRALLNLAERDGRASYPQFTARRGRHSSPAREGRS